MADVGAYSVQDEPPAPRKRPRQRRRSKLAQILSDVDLWRSPDGVAFASVPLNSHREHMCVNSSDFRTFIVTRYYNLALQDQTEGAGLSGQAQAQITNLAEARALSSPEVRRWWRRVSEHGGAIWLELGGGDPAGERRAVKITPEGWSVEKASDVPVAFLRARDAMPLPEPEESDAKPGDLGMFVNVDPASGDLCLLWAWLFCTMRPIANGGAYPILLLHGEQGSGKSFAARALQAMVDPSTLTGRALPREERDLFITASNRHLLAFDNLSSIPDGFADCLCRISTGGGFSARALHTDADESIFAAVRPLLMNGIPSTIAARPDLADRALSIQLRPLASGRVQESELRTQFDSWLHGLLGLLCDGLVSGLRNVGTTSLPDPPRMMDAATWAEACAPGVGYSGGTIADAWRRNRDMADRASLDADEVAQAVLQLAATIKKGEFVQPRLEDGAADLDELVMPEGADSAVLWKGTPTRLYARLCALASERTKFSGHWPKTAAAMANRLRRVAPGLRAGERVDVANGKGGADSQRWWTIRRVG